MFGDNSSVHLAAQQVHDAMKGAGTNESEIIAVASRFDAK